MADDTIETYEVEVILAARIKTQKTGTEDAVWEYHVKYAGYNNRFDRWQPVSSFGTDCDRLVNSFWYNVGPPQASWEAGTVVHPSQEWIDEEKQRFRDLFKADGKPTLVKKKSNVAPPSPNA
ncbi:hypothetical protein EIP91_004533 [Steccherinum ochraceum]|uniref:Chromo domain-containing protein n=1 Tax=Steccherinum ochraceum TaxID=92696 RepID=A0A4R0R8M9_9APHY|nr:hypothetical protein EIP91_004533 [Steccherinum ochraceum]